MLENGPLPVSSSRKSISTRAAACIHVYVPCSVRAGFVRTSSVFRSSASARPRRLVVGRVHAQYDGVPVLSRSLMAFLVISARSGVFAPMTTGTTDALGKIPGHHGDMDRYAVLTRKRFVAPCHGQGRENPAKPPGLPRVSFRCLPVGGGQGGEKPGPC